MPSAARVSLLPGPCGRRRDAKAEDVADMPEMQEARAAWRPLPVRREAREPCRDGARQGARQGQGQERRAVAQGLRRGRVPGQPRARHRLARGHVRSLRQARGRAPSVGQVANAAGLRSPPREAAAKRRRKPRGQPGPPVRQVPRARRRRAAPKGCPPLAGRIEKNTAHRSRPRAAFLMPNAVRRGREGYGKSRNAARRPCAPPHGRYFSRKIEIGGDGARCLPGDAWRNMLQPRERSAG